MRVLALMEMGIAEHIDVYVFQIMIPLLWESKKKSQTNPKTNKYPPPPKKNDLLWLSFHKYYSNYKALKFPSSLLYKKKINEYTTITTT